MKLTQRTEVAPQQKFQPKKLETQNSQSGNTGSTIRFGGTDGSILSDEAFATKGSSKGKPFFAQFLEDQNEAKRFDGAVTMRYPSDGDTGGFQPVYPVLGGAVTMRYPSDGDIGVRG